MLEINNVGMRMKKLFRKGQRVRNRVNGKVMEVLKYITRSRSQTLECAWYDLEKKELKTEIVKQNNLRKAS